MNSSDRFTFRPIGSEYTDDLCAIQEEAFAALEDECWLRRNSREMLEACLHEPHHTIGVFDGERMAAFAVLFIAGDSEENLGRKIGFEGEDVLSTANFKLVIVRPEYRGNGLQRTLTRMLEETAAAMGFRHICSSVSPHNRFSASNFESMGYRPARRTVLYGGLERVIYCKDLD